MYERYGSIICFVMWFRGKMSKRIAVISRKALNSSIFWMWSARKRLFAKVCVDTLWIPNLIIYEYLNKESFHNTPGSSLARLTLCWLVSGLIANYCVRSLSSDRMYNTRLIWEIQYFICDPRLIQFIMILATQLRKPSWTHNMVKSNLGNDVCRVGT